MSAIGRGNGTGSGTGIPLRRRPPTWKRNVRGIQTFLAVILTFIRMDLHESDHACAILGLVVVISVATMIF